MFKLLSNPTFSHDVTIRVPVDGGFEDHVARVRFRVLAVDDLVKHDVTRPDGQAAYCDAIVESFENLEGDDGKPIPHSDKVKARMISTPFVRVALMRAYEAAMFGARIKN
jgi:hypothetical protein